MFNNSDNLMEILKQGVNNQVNPDKKESEIVEKMDELEDCTVIIDGVEEEEDTDFPEYFVEASLNGDTELNQSDKFVEEEVGFLEADDEEDLSKFEVDPFGEDEMSVLKEKGVLSGLGFESTRELKTELPKDFFDEEDLDFEDGNFDEEDEEELSDDFEELNWGEDDSDDLEEDLPEEELALQKKHTIVIEEEIIQENPETIEETILSGTFIEEVVPDKIDKEIVSKEVPLKKSESIFETEEDTKFANCIYTSDMSIEDYLRANPKYREKMYVEHFFKPSVIDDALTRGIVFLKKGRFMI